MFIMSNNTNNLNEIDVGAWNKMCKTVSDAGFREGAAAGRNSTFQKGFDIGYHEGYKNGSALGYLKGVVSILGEQGLTVNSRDRVLEKTSRGLCQLCDKPELQTASVCELTDKQRQHVKETVEKVKTENSAILQGLVSEAKVIREVNPNPVDAP